MKLLRPLLSLSLWLGTVGAGMVGIGIHKVPSNYTLTESLNAFGPIPLGSLARGLQFAGGERTLEHGRRLRYGKVQAPSLGSMQALAAEKSSVSSISRAFLQKQATREQQCHFSL